MLFSGELLSAVDLPGKPAECNAVCVGPAHTLMVAGYRPVSVWVFDWRGQLRQRITAQQLAVVDEEREACPGITATHDHLMVATVEWADVAGVWRVYSYNI